MRRIAASFVAIAITAACAAACGDRATQVAGPEPGDRVACAPGRTVPHGNLTCDQLIRCAAASLWEHASQPSVTSTEVYAVSPLSPLIGAPRPDGYLGVSTVGGGWVVVFKLATGEQQREYISWPERCPAA